MQPTQPGVAITTAPVVADQDDVAVALVEAPDELHPYPCGMVVEQVRAVGLMVDVRVLGTGAAAAVEAPP